MSTGTPKLKRSTLVYFGLPDYAVYLAAVPVSLYLPFVYSRNLGLDLADVGLILMLARISDVVTDPLIGYLSDRTNTRFGKRKPWLATGALVMMFSAYQLFAPSGPVDNWHLLIWSMLLWLGWTMINIPYFAWGAELTDDYNERTRITGWRQAFGYLGNVSVLGIPTISGELFGYGSVPQEGLTIVGFMALVLLPLLTFVALWKVPEAVKHRRQQVQILTSSRQMFKNGSFVVLFVGFLMLTMGTTWASSLFMLFAAFVVDVETSTQLILLGFYLTPAGIAALLGMGFLSHRQKGDLGHGCRNLCHRHAGLPSSRSGGCIAILRSAGFVRHRERQFCRYLFVHESRSNRSRRLAYRSTRCRLIYGRLVSWTEDVPGNRGRHCPTHRELLRFRPERGQRSGRTLRTDNYTHHTAHASIRRLGVRHLALSTIR